MGSISACRRSAACTASPTTEAKQTAKDFTSDQEVRWCPGCGDYAVLAAVRSFLPTLGIRRENTVFVSGIGCSSRFPYYLDTYGMHSIHGRAPAIATGLAVTRPDLSVWVVTGDGDALSIGGNHLIHALRRNVNIKILLFNNRIYGLTKGQYSPTSEEGKVTKSTPMGSVDHPFNPISVALGAEATFVGRALDSDRKSLTAVLQAAAEHRGTALVEIFQDCPIFNDGSFDVLRKGDEAASRVIPLTHGEPIRFGPAGDDGLGTYAVVQEGFRLRVAKADEVDAGTPDRGARRRGPRAGVRAVPALRPGPDPHRDRGSSATSTARPTTTPPAPSCRRPRQGAGRRAGRTCRPCSTAATPGPSSAEADPRVREFVSASRHNFGSPNVPARRATGTRRRRRPPRPRVGDGSAPGRR